MSEEAAAQFRFQPELLTPEHSDWKTAPDPRVAAHQFLQDLLLRNKDLEPLRLKVDIRRDEQEQDQALVHFYSKDHVQWARPLHCRLEGDPATGSGVNRHMMSTVIFKLISGFHINSGNTTITKIFEGESNHLIPSVSADLIDNRLFTIAGRIIGHSFLHNGPSFPGLSRAVIHVLLGGSLETVPITLEDCPDLDIRNVVQELRGDGDIKDCDYVHQLCLYANLPLPNVTNRKWLAEKLLFYAVIEQTKCQIDQLREGLQDTGIWPLLIHRSDVIPILFPTESDAQLTPQMILDQIVWPSSITIIFDQFEAEDDNDSEVADTDRVSGFLKTFIENASPADLKNLTKFWTGWELPSRVMKVEVVEAPLPMAYTCFEKLRLPRHYDTFRTFDTDLRACISSSYSGFGCP